MACNKHKPTKHTGNGFKAKKANPPNAGHGFKGKKANPPNAGYGFKGKKQTHQTQAMGSREKVNPPNAGYGSKEKSKPTTPRAQVQVKFTNPTKTSTLIHLTPDSWMSFFVNFEFKR